MNETSLMRVEFKYENKAVPTASFAGTEALRCRDDDATTPRRDRRAYHTSITRRPLLSAPTKSDLATHHLLCLKLNKLEPYRSSK